MCYPVAKCSNLHNVLFIFLFISNMYHSIFVFYRPPYSPDASLDATYALINRYWTQTYRNASMLPELCAHLPSHSNNSHALSDSAVANSQSVSLVCPTCITSMRMISITGGMTFIFLFFTYKKSKHISSTYAIMYRL